MIFSSWLLCANFMLLTQPQLWEAKPAHFACRSGHLEALKLSLEDNIGKQLAPYHGGATPLHYLFRFQTEEECDEELVYSSKWSQIWTPVGKGRSHATSQPCTALRWSVARTSDVAAKVLPWLKAGTTKGRTCPGQKIMRLPGGLRFGRHVHRKSFIGELDTWLSIVTSPWI